MEGAGTVEADAAPPPPPPPTSIPSNVNPDVSNTPKHSIICRRGFGSSGRPISLLSNHFKVSINFPDKTVYQYHVLFTWEDKRAVEGKCLGRKLIDKLYQTYSSELGGKRFAYDGDKSLYTVGPLPQNNLEFTVVLEDTFARRDGIPESGEGPIDSGKRSKRSFKSKTCNVHISYAAKIPMKSIALALQGAEADSTQDGLRVLDIILRQQAANRGCLLVRQSFFHDDSRNFVKVGGGVIGCRGFHSSLRTTQGGLSLNMDVSTTMILKPGPVIDFLLENQNVGDPSQVDWARARKMLKNLRIRTTHSGMEFKIIGLSDKPCNQQFFPLKVKTNASENNEGQTLEISVYDYFTRHRNIQLSYSASLPCLDVGRPQRPNFLPLELCSLISLQRYTKALSTMQRSSLVENSRQKPHECIRIVMDAMRNYRYNEDPMLAACGINIDNQLIQVEGRVLEPPKLKVGNNQDCISHNGRWNFNNKTLVSPIQIKNWAVVNFSARCDISYLSRELINCGGKKRHSY